MLHSLLLELIGLLELIKEEQISVNECKLPLLAFQAQIKKFSSILKHYRLCREAAEISLDKSLKLGLITKTTDEREVLSLKLMLIMLRLIN